MNLTFVLMCWMSLYCDLCSPDTSVPEQHTRNGLCSPIWEYHLGDPGVAPNVKTTFSHDLHHAGPTSIDCWSQQKLFTCVMAKSGPTPLASQH